ncbi:hypothetical protein B0F87_11330 [Methylobacter tundripaludum]|uniref:Tetratricopeptide repeat protein n=1 Tax=Methylobacter tundripaludum TaxID=173365 RepID=A0A2S6H8U7_9GAMM|nr:tetratricopeptide repeat-containing protein [Methylobacter tundripaludum]PPK73919.1 hypothetical protein B0F87_11330 [Methylobacter tundripaludum]
MKLHAFVAMPFGQKKGPDGTDIDFNAIYENLLKPAIEAAGLEVFRTDEEQAAGDIKTDMFQELLIADLVVADLTLDNPNVWYELGVRHALRSRGTILVQGPRSTQPFDIYTDRKLNYSLQNGRPDPASLKKDQDALTEMIKTRMVSWHGRKISPVFNLHPNLDEPEWRRLKEGNAQQFWQAYNSWAERIEFARKQGNIGDLPVLADEAPVAAFRAEAHLKAGVALRKAEHFGFALDQLEQGLAIEGGNLNGLREKVICLQRLALRGKLGHSLEKVRAHYRKILETYPKDAETWALLVRIDKDAWVECWHNENWAAEQKRDEASYQDALLSAAIESYHQAFRRNPGHYYSCINALTLTHLYHDLGGDTRFSAECEPDQDQWFWSKATLGDLEVLTGTPAPVTAAYKEAIVHAEKNWFALNSTLAQLRLLKEQGFRPESVAAGIVVFERALTRLKPPEGQWQPRQVQLFSEHMVDASDRKEEGLEPHFPLDKVPLAEAAIAKALDQLGAGPEDQDLTQNASGGDLIFAEACQARGVKLQLLQPFPEPDFIKHSVAPAEGDWTSRFYAVKDRLEIDRPPRCMPEELGESPRKPLQALQPLVALHRPVLWAGEGEICLPVERPAW